MFKIAAIAVVAIILGLIIFDVGFLTSRYIKPNIPFIGQQASPEPSTSNKQASISGVIHLNGQIPQGSSISIGVREHSSIGNYEIFASALPAADDSAWEYKNGEDGQSYQLQAYLSVNGSQVAVSDPMTVTAPATEEVLTINIESTSTSQMQATISGILFINGYIPDGASVDILGRKFGSTGDFDVVVNNISAQVKRTITYSSAISGQKYEIQGQLFDTNGKVIGTSGSVVISAPSDNAEMTINSEAQPPAGSVTTIQNNTGGSGSPIPSSGANGTAISGTINFNGSAPGGSSIVILAKQPSDPNYRVVANGINPQNGATWSWNGATAGTTYNMVAVLKGQVNMQNIDYADSQVYNVAAPAQNQIFTLNTGISMGAPTGSVSITCGTKNNNMWNGIVNFSSVTGAQSYSFQIGSISWGSDIANVQQGAQATNNQTINVNNLKDSVIYFAQYAVSSVTSPTPAQYSPYSGAYTIKCPN